MHELIQEWKHLRGMPTRTGFMPFSFPILRCKVAAPWTEQYYWLKWSNYHKQVSTTPGLFVMESWDTVPYDPTIKINNKEYIDHIERNKNPKRGGEIKLRWRKEYATIDKFQVELIRRFDALGLRIYRTLLQHSLYQKYLQDTVDV